MRFDLPQEQLNDVRRSVDDPDYFTQKFLHIPLVDLDVEVPITQDPKLGCMQLCAYVVWHLIFRMEQTVVVISPTMEHRQSMNTIVTDMLAMIPAWFSVNVREGLKTRIVLGNNSRAVFAVASSAPIRGEAVNTFVFPKYDQVKEYIKFEMIQYLLPMLYTHATVVMSGTDERLDY
jgi:hypothetical protein